jgi:hypothetical protein
MWSTFYAGALKHSKTPIAKKKKEKVIYAAKDKMWVEFIF